MKVIFKPMAEKSIIELADFITSKILMPDTANKYIDKLILFSNKIAKAPNAYTTCKFLQWKKRKLKCATFDNTWVLAFKIVKSNVVIYHIVNGKLLKY
jgi:hypothetical protein